MNFNRFLLLEEDTGEPKAGEESKDENAETENTTTEDKKEVIQSVSLEDHQKIVKQFTEQKETLDSLQATMKKQELDSMKSQERWKEIAELKEKEADEANTKVTNMSQALMNDKKYSSIKELAMRSGIKKEALDDLELIDFPEVQLETTSLGNYNVIGTQAAIESLKLKRPHWFGRKSGSLNTNTPEVIDGGKVTIDLIQKAEDKFRKSGNQADHAAYEKLTLQYQKQR